MEKFIHRVSPDEILDLQEEEVFVYGSNLSGRHGKGAARQALKWGSEMGGAIRTYGNDIWNSHKRQISKKNPRYRRN